ncbi:MAG: acetyl-CoA carboxylase biotin carboxylase subunit [Alphaproteobacteria bacterium]
MFKKVLIANRGEIALRIHRACHEMGIQTVAVHSTADADAMHVKLADESVCIGPAASSESYLNVAAILSAAAITNADAVHPGVGFLSENAEFAAMVEEHGFVFIGPSPKHITMMGDKVIAKKTVTRLGIPVVPGTEDPIDDLATAKKVASEIKYPVLIKAAGGGGGRGMQVVEKASELEEKISIAQREAEMFFGNKSVFMEKYLGQPRHIEVQVVGDGKGEAIHLGERDCSIQRRHQKVIEEAPSPALNDEQRAYIGELCRKATAEMNYRGAGTFEFLYENEEFFFIEMNTRIQVEHTISEMITGIDLVQEQLRIASGLPLSVTQDEINIEGWAIESRINAEHPETFLPSPGKVTDYHVPGGLGVRVDSAVYAGYTIPSSYDSMIAKLIVHGKDREGAIKRLERSLREYVITGVQTLIPLHQRILGTEEFRTGNYDTHWLETYLEEAEAEKDA